MELMEEKNTPTMEIYTRANQLSPLPFLNTLSPITSTRAPQLKEKNWDGGFSTWEAKISNCEQDRHPSSRFRARHNFDKKDRYNKPLLHPSAVAQQETARISLIFFAQNTTPILLQTKHIT